MKGLEGGSLVRGGGEHNRYFRVILPVQAGERLGPPLAKFPYRTLRGFSLRHSPVCLTRALGIPNSVLMFVM